MTTDRNGRMQVFISHSSDDQQFVRELASDLKRFGVSVWYDEWEIAVGDSIVDRVFDALENTDALVVVLSAASVQSRWVREELNTGVIRRINDSDITLLPVLKEDCTVPTPLKHIRYADFRHDYTSGLMELMDAIEPMRTLWESLHHLKEHHTFIVEQIKNADLDQPVDESVQKLHELMSSALDVRSQIEMRRARRKVQSEDFFQKIGTLADSGLDIRSQTWNTLVSFRSIIVHKANPMYMTVRMFAEHLRERYDMEDLKERISHALDRLSGLMTEICERPIPMEEIREMVADQRRYTMAHQTDPGEKQ